eukprot:COSAG02_NODE_2538_length_8577_cov_16.981835_6_plen_118_part_00
MFLFASFQSRQRRRSALQGILCAGRALGLGGGAGEVGAVAAAAKRAGGLVQRELCAGEAARGGGGGGGSIMVYTVTRSTAVRRSQPRALGAQRAPSLDLPAADALPATIATHSTTAP